MKPFLLAMTTLFALVGCQSTPRAEPASTNRQAALTGTLPYNPLAWRVVTSWTNERQSTMSTLYGNDLAIEHVRSNSDLGYPAGAVLALVTWSQRDDPHWFGARIPSTPQSVEFVAMPRETGPSPSYERYQGSPLKQVKNIDGNIAAQRVAYLLSQRAAVMP
jgi:hypothetical protein